METIYRVAALGLILSGSACSKVPMAQVEAARVTRSVVDIAADAIEDVCTMEAVREKLMMGGRPAAETFVRRCKKAAETQHAAVVLWQEWVEEMLAVQTGEAFDWAHAMSLSRRLLRAYKELQAVLELLGARIPELPAFFDTLDD